MGLPSSAFMTTCGRKDGPLGEVIGEASNPIRIEIRPPIHLHEAGPEAGDFRLICLDCDIKEMYISEEIANGYKSVEPENAND